MRRLLTPRVRKWLVYLSLFYVAIIAVDVVLIATVFPHFKEIRPIQPDFQGCFLTSALVGYVECQGFFASELVQWIVNLPLSLLYYPLFGVMALARGIVWLLFLAVLVWLPILFLIWQGFRKLRALGSSALKALRVPRLVPPLGPRLRNLLFYASLLYVTVIVLDMVLIAGFLPHSQDLGAARGQYQGCYLGGGDFHPPTCQNFVGSTLATNALNLPYAAFLMPFIGIKFLVRHSSPWILLFALASWLPILFAIREGISRLKKSGPGAADGDSSAPAR